MSKKAYTTPSPLTTEGLEKLVLETRKRNTAVALELEELSLKTVDAERCLEAQLEWNRLAQERAAGTGEGDLDGITLSYVQPFGEAVKIFTLDFMNKEQQKIDDRRAQKIEDRKAGDEDDVFRDAEQGELSQAVSRLPRLPRADSRNSSTSADHPHSAMRLHSKLTHRGITGEFRSVAHPSESAAKKVFIFPSHTEEEEGRR